MQPQKSSLFSVRAICRSGKTLPFSLAFTALALLAAIFRAFSLGLGPAALHGAVFLLLALLGGLSLLAFRRSFPEAALPQLSFMAAFLALGIFLRIYYMDFVSDDYSSFLSHWVEHFRQNGHFLGIADKIGDYNVLYQYFLALFSCFPLPDLYLIKLLSICFDFLLACSAMKLLGLMTEDSLIPCLGFIAVFLAPTVVLNGACWAQCDSVYVSLALLSLYLVLSKRPLLSMAFLAAAFSFKLQTIFIMPLYFILLFTGRLKIRQLFVFPLVYFLTIVPALLLGKPLTDILGVYFSQAASYSGYISLNAPTVYNFFTRLSPADISRYTRLGITVSAAAVLALCALAAALHRRLNDRVLLLFAAVFALLLPFLLPKMHDRYFFFADVLSIICVLTLRRRYYIAALVVASSYSCYYAYLELTYLVMPPFGSAMMLLALLLLLHELALELVNAEARPLKALKAKRGC